MSITREAEIKLGRQRLAAGVRCLAFVGAAGIGKSRLARHLARQLPGAFPGGRLWVDAGSCRNLGDLMRALASPLKLDPTSGIDDIERELGNAGEIILILDGCDKLRARVAGQIAQLQVVITGLLVLCLVVAFFGIVNTMALAVLERTREIGLLRAVGMTRRQLRTSVRWEAAIISLFGSLLGIALGLVLGAAAVVAIPDSFVSSIGIPWGQLVVYALVGGGLGVLAAWFPARRAAKLDVLDAIATE